MATAESRAERERDKLLEELKKSHDEDTELTKLRKKFLALPKKTKDAIKAKVAQRKMATGEPSDEFGLPKTARQQMEDRAFLKEQGMMTSGFTAKELGEAFEMEKARKDKYFEMSDEEIAEAKKHKIDFRKLAHEAAKAIQPKRGSRKSAKSTSIQFSSAESAGILDSILTNGANMIISNKFLSMLAGFFAIEMIKYVKPCDHGWQDVMIMLQGIGVTGYMNSELEGEMETIITALGLGGTGVAAALSGVRPDCSEVQGSQVTPESIVRWINEGVWGDPEGPQFPQLPTSERHRGSGGGR